MSAVNANTAGLAEIKQAMQRWQDAVQTKDVAQIMANYTADVVAYDAILQLRFNGKEAYGKHWQLCLEMCTNDMVFEPAETHISVSGELALVYCLIRCGEKDKSGRQNAVWMRVTTGYKKVDGQWLIEHEHFSVPFDIMSMKALFDLDPDNEHKVRSVPSGMNTVTPHLVCADAIYEQAIAAGAIPVMPIDDIFWGDRYGVLKDPFGHNWSIATHMRDVSEEDIREAVKGFA